MEDGNQHLVLAKSKKEEEDEAYLKSLPAGYRFKPRDEELVDFYLRKKVNGKPLPANRIKEVELYKYDPETLTTISKNKSFNGMFDEWYYFTPRDRKYRNGSRPGRGAGDGFWKATGVGKHVKRKGKSVGFKNTLVFYKGKPPRGQKTNWIMHEFVLSDLPATQRTGDNVMQLDKFVLCRLHKNKDGIPKLQTTKQAVDQEDKEAEDPIFPAQTETQNQEYCFPSTQAETQDQDFWIQPQTEAQNHQEHEILPQTETQNQGYWIEPETQNKGNWVPYPEPVERFQVQSFHMLPQARQDSTFGGLPQFPGSLDPGLNYDHSVMFPQQAAVSGYGSSRPTFPSSSSSVPPPPPDDQFQFMGQNNFNLHYHHHLQQQQQFPDSLHNYDFSIDDKFLLDADFGLP